MNKGSPKRHHYVPEYFIKEFSNREDFFVFVYDKKTQRIETKARSAGSICYEINLHTIFNYHHNSVLIEETFSKFENEWAKAFTILKENPNEHILFSDQNTRNILLSFISFQFWRTPKRKFLVSDYLESIHCRHKKAISTGNLLVDFTSKDLKFFIKRSKESNTQKMLQFFILPVLYFFMEEDDDRVFKLIKKPEKYLSDFILSDDPVAYEKMENISDKHAHILIPFSKDYILSFGDKNREPTFDQIESMQKNIFESAERWVIASSPEGLQKHF